ncbi:MAG: transcriptional regulator [Intrasporangium sp.]|uniref:ATP-binding protein n=1 Tax=Intrasporangium sp. TaxID=1925024 RepID=UPI0026474650|nr:BTAD domain-containing putative transcriptional regulator [Intrasporangium sp.]MDN5796670.1 transcriptional regulator [Intrasporangium sp.]
MDSDLVDRNRLGVCVDVLGPLILRVQGHDIDVPGPRRRALLALLALEGRRGLSPPRIVDLLWPEDPPDNALQAVYSHISRLRGHLGPLASRVERRSAGYRLRLEPFELDVDAARRWAERHTAAALDLWRGPALGEFSAYGALEAAAVGLGELRLRLVDDLLEQRLAARDPDVVMEAVAAASESPLRERTAQLHVRALAAENRTAEAMTAAQAFRRRLVDETGLDPSETWARLEERVAARTAGPPAAPRPIARVGRPDGPMFGRQHDREEVVRLLSTHAVVTLSGPGGVGKTRLALDIASHLAPGQEAIVVTLSVVDRADHVCSAVAAGLGLAAASALGVPEIVAALTDRRLLLVLDNCEHVVDACRELVNAIHRGAPGVQVLSTSRGTLQLADEYVVRLQPLPVPRDVRDVAAVRRQSSVRAFVEYARRRRPGFDFSQEEAGDLVEVLRRLDGLPLGIELAARQVAVMPLAALRERLDRALDLSTGRSAPQEARQQTLRATIDSSYRLLNDDEQRLLRLLAPFLGGVDLPTIEALADGLGSDPLDLLHRLVDSSLVVADPVSGRYQLLFTVRTFLLDELRLLGQAEEAHQRFVTRCRVVAEEIRAEMSGPAEQAGDRRLRAELDNLRAALDRAGLADRVAIVVAVNQVVTWRDLPEIWAWATDLVEDPAVIDDPAWWAILACAAEAARLLGELDTARRRARQVIDASDPGGDPGALLRAWSVVAVVDHFGGDFTAAREAWLRAASGPGAERSTFIGSAALAAAYDGDHQTARALLAEARTAATSASHRAFAAYVEGELLAPTHPTQALGCYETAITEAARVGCTFVEGVAKVSLASTRTRVGDLAGAAEGFADLITTWRRTGQSTQLWTTARNAAELLAVAGSQRAAALVLIVAAEQPGAAAVDAQIARFSRRSYLPLAELVDDSTRAELVEEARWLSSSDVLDHLLAELETLGSSPPHRLKDHVQDAGDQATKGIEDEQRDDLEAHRERSPP